MRQTWAPDMKYKRKLQKHGLKKYKVNRHWNKIQRGENEKSMFEMIITEGPQPGEKHLSTDSRSPKNVYKNK